MSLGIPVTYSFNGVAALRDNLAIDHLKLARVDDGGIGDRDDLLVCHLRYGVGEVVTACTACRTHSLTSAGRELYAAWIQCESRTGNGVGNDNVRACSE